MPTTLERTTITHTAAIGQLLSVAAREWPEVTSDRDLMIRLMGEGASALRRQELEAAYEQAYLEWDGTADADLWSSTSGDGLEGNR